MIEQHSNRNVFLAVLCELRPIARHWLVDVQLAAIDKHVRAWEKPSDHVPVAVELKLAA